MNEQMRDPVELERRKRLLEAEFLNPDQSLGLLPEDYGQPEAPLYDDSQGVQVAGVDRAVLPSRDIASDEEITMPLPPRKPIKLPVASGRTMRESQATGETKTPIGKYDLLTKPEEANLQGQVEQGFRERQLEYEAGRSFLENYQRLKKEREGRDPDSVKLDELRDFLMKKMEEAEARRNGPVDPANPISAMLLGLGGGLAGAYSGQPNTGHLIAGSAIKARDDAMERRLKLIDTTPEVKGILAAMKMKEDRAKGREAREMNYEKLIVDNLSKLADSGGKMGEEARKVQELLINARKSGAQLDIDKYKAELDRLKQSLDRKSKLNDWVIKFGEELNKKGLPGTRAALDDLGNTLGVPVYNLSKTPSANKALADKLGVNIAIPPQSTAGQAYLATLPREKHELLSNIRADMMAAVQKVKHELTGSSETTSELNSWLASMEQGTFNTTEEALAGLARVYGRINADRKNLLNTYGRDAETRAEIERSFPAFVDKTWAPQSPTATKPVARPTIDDLNRLRIEKSKQEQKMKSKTPKAKGRQ